MQEKLGENSSEKRLPVLDVYECCPKFENESFLLRPVMEEDCNALLKVYSDPQAVPLFNSDNC
ncbi:N-acetyltransferase, partial [bacterium]|nr:N-acetyltransferase [bacterium]